MSALPDGTSADPTGPVYLNLLQPYLTNNYPALLASELQPGIIVSQTLLVPGA